MTTPTIERVMVLDEPELEFRYGQRVQDPRDGLALFGPYDADESHSRTPAYGVIGTPEGIDRFRAWSAALNRAAAHPAPTASASGRPTPASRRPSGRRGPSAPPGRTPSTGTPSSKRPASETRTSGVSPSWTTTWPDSSCPRSVTNPQPS